MSRELKFLRFFFNLLPKRSSIQGFDNEGPKHEHRIENPEILFRHSVHRQVLKLRQIQTGSHKPRVIIDNAMCRQLQDTGQEIRTL